MPRAASLAAAIKSAVDCEPELVEGTNGVFDVVADGALVFSKHREGRFPESDEVLDALRALAGAGS